MLVATAHVTKRLAFPGLGQGCAGRRLIFKPERGGKSAARPRRQRKIRTLSCFPFWNAGVAWINVLMAWSKKRIALVILLFVFLLNSVLIVALVILRSHFARASIPVNSSGNTSSSLIAYEPFD